MVLKTAGRAALGILSATVFVVLAGGGGGGGCGGGGSSGGGTTGGGSGGGTTGGGSSAAEPYTGSVILADEAAGTSFVHGAVVEILATPAASAPACNGGTVSGSCCYSPPVQMSDAGTTIPTAYSAGSITVSDNGSTIGTIAFSDGGLFGGAYALSTSAATFTWNPGDSLGVSAPGATIDSFTATVKVPALIAGLTPALSYTAPTTITLASDWPLTWTPDTTANETMIVTVTPQGSPAKGEIACTVQDSAGTVTFPSALLGNFSGATNASVIAVRYAGLNATDANASVHVLAQVEVGGSATLK